MNVDKTDCRSVTPALAIASHAILPPVRRRTERTAEKTCDQAAEKTAEKTAEKIPETATDDTPCKVAP